MGSMTTAFVKLDECTCISIYSLSDFMFRIVVIWISSPELSCVLFTLMPCLYVLLCGPKTRNLVSYVK